MSLARHLSSQDNTEKHLMSRINGYHCCLMSWVHKFGTAIDIIFIIFGLLSCCGHLLRSSSSVIIHPQVIMSLTLYRIK